MRRKSTRNANKSPEKALKEIETPPPVKARRSRRRKHTPSSKSSDTEDDEVIRKHSNKRSSSATTTTTPATTTETTTTTTTVEETPDTTTKSHTPSDDENNDGTSSQEPVWKVTTSSDEQHHGEIQKLKICLTRPSPDSPEKTKPQQQRSRSKSNSQTEDDTTTSSEDKSTTPTTRRSTRTTTTTTRGSPFVDEGDEQKKGKGKSKGKHKTKIEQSPKLNETNNDNQTMNIEISENVQVTQQSPTIDKRVDIEKDDDDNKVVDDVDNGECSKINDNDSGTVDNKEKSDEIIESEQKSIDKTDDKSNVNNKNDQKVNKNDDDDDDKPLSRIVEQNVEEKSSETEKSKIEQEKPEIIEKDDKNESTEEQAEETEITEENNKIHEETSEESSKIHEETSEESSKIHEETSEESSKIHEETSEERSKIHDEAENNQSEDRVEEPKNNQAEKDKIEQSENKSDTENVDKSKEEVRQAETTSMETEDSTATLNITSIKKDARKSQHRRLIRDRELDKTIETIEKAKSKWNINLEKSSNLIKIDLEVIQIVYSTTIEFPEEPDLNIDTTVPQSIQERRRSSQTIDKKIERKISIEQQKFDDKIDENIEQATNSNNDGDNSKSNIIAYNRKISIVDDTASKLKPPPSPAKNPIAQVLFITNLVRPFTIKQLRELLERTGKIVEDGFWTDRIKSKCYVQYETVEEAEATRNALHGVQWPIGNGKKLIIDYATIEDLENAKNPPPPVTPTATVPEVVATKENLEPSDSATMVDDRKIKDMEKRRPDGPIREWDIGKKDVRRERSRSRDRDNRKHRRSPTPIDDFITKKQKKSEEVVPQKLMDDLFLKTKATPSIYWQPLSPEEIATKQQQRLIRMEEHKRRIEESSRFRPRDGRGGNFRRRYD